MIDLAQVRESLRESARSILSQQPHAEKAEDVIAELVAVLHGELDRLEGSWCGPKGRWGALPTRAQLRRAAKPKEPRAKEPKAKEPKAKEPDSQ